MLVPEGKVQLLNSCPVTHFNTASKKCTLAPPETVKGILPGIIKPGQNSANKLEYKPLSISKGSFNDHK